VKLSIKINVAYTVKAVEVAMATMMLKKDMM
jgi:hypothetical protein